MVLLTSIGQNQIEIGILMSSFCTLVGDLLILGDAGIDFDVILTLIQIFVLTLRSYVILDMLLHPSATQLAICCKMVILILDSGVSV